MMHPNTLPPLTRRELLNRIGSGFGAIGLAGVLSEANASAAKAMSVGNLKQVWTNEGRAIDWFDSKQSEGRWFLEHATQVKNIWVPYGE